MSIAVEFARRPVRAAARSGDPGRYHLRSWQGGRVRDRTFEATGRHLRIGFD